MQLREEQEEKCGWDASGTLRTIYMTIKQHAFIIGSQNEHFRVHWAKITFSSWPRTWINDNALPL